MGSLTLIGLGLNAEDGITLKGLEAARRADKVYLESYTSLMPQLSLEKLSVLLGKEIARLGRKELEETPEGGILKDSLNHDVALLVPGDPMTATTHVDLRLRARKLGVRTRIIAGVSIVTAAAGACGLQSYKFGRTVTIPFASETYRPPTPYHVLRENSERGLHTLLLLDINAEEGRFLSVREGLEYLRYFEGKLSLGVAGEERLAVGLARVGADTEMVKADRLARLREIDFGPPPHALIFPGTLHFMEEEALRAFADAPL